MALEQASAEALTWWQVLANGIGLVLAAFAAKWGLARGSAEPAPAKTGDVIDREVAAVSFLSVSNFAELLKHEAIPIAVAIDKVGQQLQAIAQLMADEQKHQLDREREAQIRADERERVLRGKG